jgi:hypothetical protein
MKGANRLQRFVMNIVSHTLYLLYVPSRPRKKLRSLFQGEMDGKYLIYLRGELEATSR